MEAFIPAAGLGTRLHPLTLDRPKALVEVGGKTLLERTIERLADVGVSRVVVNVHHMAEMMTAYLETRGWPCEVVVSDERERLLDTGGGLRHAAPLFSGREEVLVHNVDVLSTIDLGVLLKQHREEGNLATLCVSDRPSARKLLFDSDGRLVGRAVGSREQGAGSRELAFSGMAVISPRLFGLLPEADHPYPIIDEYIRLSVGESIRCHEHEAWRWLDVGKPDTLQKAQQWIHSWGE